MPAFCKIPFTMKKLFLLLVSVSFILNAGLCHESEQTPGATVYFFRLPSYAGSGVAITILINDKPVVQLKNRSVYRHELPGGEYTVTARMGHKTSVRLRAEPGKSYYIKCYMLPGFWSAIPQLELVDHDAGRAIVEGGSLNIQAYRPVSSEPPASRAGVVLGGGIGFENIDMGYTTEMDELTLSTGGGVWIGAEYGYEVFRYLDIAADFGFRISSLKPPVRNGEADFTRFTLGITPSLVIPVKGGDYIKIRLGAGPGLYLNGTMKVTGDVAGGDDILIKYYKAFGWHGLLAFDTNISDKSSFSIGVRPYVVYYEFNPARSNLSSPGFKVRYPDGSGIDFYMGFYFRF